MRRCDPGLIMPGPIFHIDNKGALSGLRLAPFAAESDVQALIAEHPEILGADPEADEGRFVIERAGPLPPGANHCPRWSVDHLFLARDAVPTVVETHLGADRLRVGDLFGQILYYAANVGLWWPVEDLRAGFAAAARTPKAGVGAVQSKRLGEAWSPEPYWQRVAANLASGRVRMVLAVDQVEPELARMVAFLAGQLRDAEVWLLEIRQRAGPSGRLLQLALAGRTLERPPVIVAPPPAPPRMAAPARAGGFASTPSSRAAWVSDMRTRCDAEEVAALDDLLHWMGEQYGATFLIGQPCSALRLVVKEAGKDRFPFGVTEAKTAAIHLGSLSASRAFEAEDARRSLVRELAATGLEVTLDDLNSDVVIPLKALGAPDQRAGFLTVLDGVIEALRLVEAPGAFPS